MEFVPAIAEKVTDSLFEAAGGQLSYLFHYNDNVQALNEQVNELAGRRERVRVKMDTAKGNGETIFTDVQNWMEKVDKISAEAALFSEKVKESKRCLKGRCINLGQHYRLSKVVKNKALAISNLLQQVGKDEVVSYTASVSGMVSSSKVFSSGAFESRNSIKNQILKVLTDDHNVNLIGICGMGGVGKTTLVKDISKQVIEDKKYDAVVMAVLSQAPSTVKIQEEIASMLDLTLSTNIESVRARYLRERIKKENRILVVLDDIRRKIELDTIGIPFGDDHKGCKVVITSRSKFVCTELDCRKVFAIATLSKQEGWVLFKEIAGEIVKKSDIDLTARDVADQCDGLPIAIVTVARALKGKNEPIWSDAARQLKMSTPINILGMKEHVLSSLEQSFNDLGKAESKLFLFCSLFPDDYRISIEDLVRYCIALRLFEDTNPEEIKEARDRVYTIVSNITSYFLLIDVGEKYVKMHYVVRAFAITIASKHNYKFMVKSGIGLKEWPNGDTFEDFTYISLIRNDIRELSDGLKCPKVQALLMQNNNGLFIRSNFFQGMEDLNVLDLGQTYIKTLPDSLLFLTNLRTLQISGCKLDNLSVVGKLSKLEILSLSKSSIQEVPDTFSQLTNLRLLDLNFCMELKVPYSVISSLQKLKELYINRFEQWQSESENKSNAELIELQALSRLTSMQIHIPNLDLSPKFLPSFQNLSSFILRIGYSSPGADNFLDESQYSRIIKLSKISITIINDWVKSFPERTECLILEVIANLKSISPNLVRERFNKLKFLGIRSCNEIKYLLDTSEWTSDSTFHNLQELLINDNPNLVELCHELQEKGDHQCISLHNLKSIKLRSCNKLIKLFSPTLLQSLICLEEIGIGDCNELEEIFEKKEALDQEIDHSIISPSLGNLTSICITYCYKLKNLFSPSLVKYLVKLKELTLMHCSTIQEIITDEKGEKKVVFPSLYYLELRYLGSLTCFSSGAYITEFPTLERLKIHRCQNLKTFGCSEQVTPKLNKVHLEDKQLWKDDLNATVKAFFNEEEKRKKKMMGALEPLQNLGV